MAEEEKEEAKGFKVQDRRRFSAEGELKPEHRGPDEERERTAAPSEQRAPTEAAAGAAAAVRQEQPAGSAEINFAAFIVSLSTQALFHLGEISDPATNRAERDLPAAQQVIDILGLLREKTRGNLDHDEEGLLDSILFDLRMKYVEIARQQGL